MKKLVTSLLLVVVPLLATPPNLCESNPFLPQCGGIVGPEGPQGEQGIPGVDGKDGVDGAKGDKGDSGDTGATGPAGKDGVDGNDGSTGETGATGPSGEMGQTGTTGKTGPAGEAGQDGKDADETRVNALEADRKKLNSFANDAAAGSSAMASMDFGSIKEGETHGGLGIGVSKSWYGSSTAGSVGLKHGMTDDTAAVIKVWSAGSNSYGGGAGVVHKF